MAATVSPSPTSPVEPNPGATTPITSSTSSIPEVPTGNGTAVVASSLSSITPVALGDPPRAPGATPSSSSPSIASTSNRIPSSESPASSSAITQPSKSTSTSTSTGQIRASNTPTPDGRLANGAVAGVAVAVALGLALATFIATFLVMRRRRASGPEQDHKKSTEKAEFTSGTANRQSPQSEPKKLIVTEFSERSSPLGNYLPQSADDKTVQNDVKTMLDQVELYVENFYQNDSGLSSFRPDTDLAVFDSPNLPSSLTTLLPQSRHATILIKHALAQLVTTSISPSSRPGFSLLPDEFISVPTVVESAKNGGSTKPGFDQCMSQWRVLTAYLRPTPSQDSVYIARRDDRIDMHVKLFSRAFAPWRNLKHEDDVCMRSLSAIFRSASNLGIFLFSQPSDLRFYWPKQNEVGANRTVVVPSLIKRTDEKGQALVESQVMLKAVIGNI